MRLDEAGLVAWLDGNPGPLLRHETAKQYAVPSDGDDYGRYLAGEAKPSPEVGAGWREFVGSHRVRRVRVLTAAPSRFVSFECEWQYTANVLAGETIRVLDLSAGGTPSTPLELWCGAHDEVVVMHYDDNGGFLYADLQHDPLLNDRALDDWHRGISFGGWWQRHPEHHRAAWLTAQPQAAVSGS